MTATREAVAAAMPSTADHLLPAIDTNYQRSIVQMAIMNNEDNH
tara:strand:+ start:72 stop:203 length:132 start_codon:yes stop_codon:yes gene_type:complete